MDTYKNILAKNMKKYREAEGYTLEEISFASGITASIWSSYENNRGNPTLDTLEKISNTLNVPLSDLFKTSDDSFELYDDIRFKSIERELRTLSAPQKEHILKIMRHMIALSKLPAGEKLK